MENKWILAPFMIETSHSYCKAAQITWDLSFQVSVTNAALSIEILLKSFNSVVVANKGKLNERYKFNSTVLKKKQNRHDLVHLFDALPLDVKNVLHDQFTFDILDAYRHAFIQDRYFYEAKAGQSASDALISVANDMIKKTVQLYIKRDCRDPWILNYPNG